MKLQIFFQQIFIVFETLAIEIKIKNLSRTTRFGVWLFYKCSIRQPPVQDDHFSVIPKVVILCRFDCK